jgi:hypothetical protein
VEYRFFTVDHQRMTGIVPALEADDRGGPVGQQIDDLAFSFITPLGADDNNVP